ncbi:MAG: hypothetical protein KJZ80_21100 [Hyphomicrobiaceae bacterium]|nr:hypothetical protein [Hyphomicrobiaceae bacterium]
MILKTRRFELPRLVLFNAAAGVIGLATLAYIVHDAVVEKTALPCSERYRQALAFGLQRDGSPLTTADLQARLAGRDWGLVGNASIVRIDGGPSPVALKIELPSTAAAPAGSDEMPSGIGYRWTPRQLENATSVCLAYSIRFPEDFEFGTGGALPGLFGAARRGDGADVAEFSIRSRWRDGGRIEIRGSTGARDTDFVIAVDPQRTWLKRGTWVRIEQEVVRNRTGAADGSVLVWIDGEMKAKRDGLVIDPQGAGLAGAIGDVHYSSGDLSWAPSPRTSSVLMSPLELRWQ